MNSWSKVIKSPRWAKRHFCLNRDVKQSAPPQPADEWRQDDAAAVISLLERQVQEKTRDEEKAAAFAQGAAEGRQQARAEYESSLARLHGILSELDNNLQASAERERTGAAALAMAVVRRILGDLGEKQKEIIRQTLKQVLAKQRRPGEVWTVHLHPEDHRRIAPDESVAPRNLKWVADDKVSPGGCRVVTQLGDIDATLETQAQKLEKILQEGANAGESVEHLAARIEAADTVVQEGRVSDSVGLVLEAHGPRVTVGECCEVCSADESRRTLAEVVGFKNNRVLLMPLDDARGIGPGSRVIARGEPFRVPAGGGLLGRVINGRGEPIDNLGPLRVQEWVRLNGVPNNPMERRPIQEPLYTGVRAIDGLLTCGKGMRMGIFAGSGVGKSVLLGMMARNTRADVNVIALIGERGREVKEFVERDLGPEGLKRSVVVAVTSDESPVLRIHGAQVAASLAEYFARQGRDVLFMMDSVTRFAMAHREVGLAAGEPPATKGYTPSAFAALPKLLERCGIFGDRGSITGIYTVLVEGDDLDEPVADHARSILDGHIVLTRALFAQNHFPSIDVLQSISRLSRQVCTPEQLAWAGHVREVLATMAEAQDLINIGAYAQGSNARIDEAIRRIDPVKMFLQQRWDEAYDPNQVWEALRRVGAPEKGRPS